jgi:O-methyltransferase involved in polyketide biosynthesis
VVGFQVPIKRHEEAVVLNLGCGLDTTFDRVDDGKACWYARIKPGASILIMLAGVVYYFTAAEVRGLLREFEKHFGKTEVIFDYSSPRGVQVANKSVLKNAGMKEGAMLKWGIDDLREMESWGCGIKVIEDIPMFRPSVDSLVGIQKTSRSSGKSWSSEDIRSGYTGFIHYNDGQPDKCRVHHPALSK